MQTDTGTALCLSAFRGSCIRTILAAFSFLSEGLYFLRYSNCFRKTPVL